MSNSNKISIDKLSSELQKTLQEYKENIEEEVKEIADKKIIAAKNELKAISPRASKTVKLKGGTTVVPRKLCEIMEYKKRGKNQRNIF